jgi:hypothetical protein
MTDNNLPAAENTTVTTYLTQHIIETRNTQYVLPVLSHYEPNNLGNLKHEELGFIGLNIPFFTQHHFTEIDRVHCSGQHFKHYSRQYSKMTCDTIATEWINNKTFSYLARPQNIEGKFYYAIKGPDMKYKNTFEWREGIFGTVVQERFNEFMNQLASLIEVNLLIDRVTKKIQNRYIIFLTLSIVFVLISVGFFVFVPFSVGSFYPLYLSIGFFFLIAFVTMLMFIPRKHVRDYEIYTYYLINTNVIEDYINSWNIEYFIPNDVYITCPRNMNYIQINVGVHRLMTLDRHVFPYEL